MLGQDVEEYDYNPDDFVGPVMPVTWADDPFASFQPIDPLDALNAFASVGQDYSYPIESQPLPAPVDPLTDFFNFPQPNLIPTPATVQANPLPDTGFWGKVGNVLSDIGKNLSFGGGAGPSSPAMPVPVYGSQPVSYAPGGILGGGGLNLASIALLAGGAYLIFALSRRKR